MVPPEQTVPQVPQLLESLCVSVQEPEHDVSPVPHVAAQAPAVQTWPVVQAWPHAPQLATSLVVFTQLPPHDISPAGQ